MMSPNERYQKLKQHLAEENPVLLDVIETYKELDKIGYKTGLLNSTQSYAAQISWWPLISVLGTFSAGKSSFINQYTGRSVQLSGNQAVDDKFTVICYGNGDEVHTLPGLALDADPRFPFFGITQEIEKVDKGEGKKIDQYLQLKTVPESVLRGKILIDSPGFDADSQRDSTLRITDHIIEMSDLVLVFFDARHPEPGAMRDTLEHLVRTNIGRKDGDKILYILNQIDTAAQDDNPEEVISSWQRALSQQGLISGNFYSIYNEKLAVTIDDPSLAERFKRKKDLDLELITARMDKVSIERAYRIAHAAEHIVNTIRDEKIPALEKAISRWRTKVIVADVLIIAPIVAAVIWGIMTYPHLFGSFIDWIKLSMTNGAIVAGAIFVFVYATHMTLRNKFAKMDAKKLFQTAPDIADALLYNNRFWRGLFSKNARGWTKRTQNRLTKVMHESKSAIQKLTDQFANPSGEDKVIAVENEVLAEQPKIDKHSVPMASSEQDTTEENTAERLLESKGKFSEPYPDELTPEEQVKVTDEKVKEILERNQKTKLSSDA